MVFEGEKSDKLLISYTIHADNKGQSWIFLETSEILEFSVEQILATKVKVQYLGSVRIQCKLVLNHCQMKWMILLIPMKISRLLNDDIDLKYIHMFWTIDIFTKMFLIFQYCFTVI